MVDGGLDRLGAMDLADRIDPVLDRLMRLARIPGAALAVVQGGRVVFEKAYGVSDLEHSSPMTADTVYPIASTTKAMNATLIGMLADEGRLAWDAPVRTYLPGFRVGDAWASDQVSLRDLLCMRTGLPRHDHVWMGRKISRAEIAASLASLPLSASFRDRFQYNNMTATTAGHVAERVTGQSWERLVQERIFEPLGMGSTTPGAPGRGRLCASYHETRERRLVRSAWVSCESTAPSGGSVLSTVGDMAKWICFNLAGGVADGRQLIAPATLRQIQSPQIGCGADLSAPSPGAAYGMGWFVDSYNGRARVAHGGYLHDVSSEVSLWPALDLGMVSFLNFGCPLPARYLNQAVFDCIAGGVSQDPPEDRLAQYEGRIAALSARLAAEGDGRPPARPVLDYCGLYRHPAYGCAEVIPSGAGLRLRLDDWVVDLEPWRHDVWAPRSSNAYAIHAPNPFDRSNRAAFDADDDGEICGLRLNLEPAVAPIRFSRSPAA